MPLHDAITYNQAEVITDANTTHAPSSMVLFGKATAEQMDFYVNGGWVAFGTIQPGALIPLQATGARDSGDAAPSAGEIIFLR